MYSYSAYDLQIQSAFELPELPVIDIPETNPDIEIVRSPVDPVPKSVNGVGGRRITATSDAVRVTHESIGSFLVESGDRIVCDPLDDEPSQQEFFRRLIENELLGLVLYQRDYLVLHASAVSVDGRAAIFLGPRGAGKSTTAAAFSAAGHSVLEDDVVAIRFDRSMPTVVPGVPQLRLPSDTTVALGMEEFTTPSEESWYEKQMLRVEETPDPVPLGGCYLLVEGKTCSFETVAGTEQMMQLITHTHARGLLGDTDQSSVHFGQCSQLTESVPVRRLKRPQNHELLQTVIELVVDDLNKM
jgi:hypothetical protein